MFEESIDLLECNKIVCFRDLREKFKTRIEYIEKNKISEVVIDRNEIVDESDVIIICRWLESKECWITLLDIGNIFSMKQESIKKLGNALCLNTSVKTFSIYFGSKNDTGLYRTTIRNQFFEFLAINNTITKFVYSDWMDINPINEIMVKNSSIIDIDLSHNMFNPGIVQSFHEMMMSRNNFKAITVNNCTFRDDCVTTFLDALENNKELTKLSMNRIILLEHNFRSLSKCLKSFPNLEILDIGMSPLLQDFSYFCKQLKYLTNLKYLNISGCMKGFLHDDPIPYDNSITRDNFSLLSESLKQCKQLNLLDISCHSFEKVTDEFDKLFDSTPNLTKLYVTDCLFSTGSFTGLMNRLKINKKLKELYLSGRNKEAQEEYKIMCGLMDVIRHNNSLTVIDIGYFYSINESSFEDIFKSLVDNHTLKYFDCRQSDPLTEPMFLRLIECLKSNHSLTCFPIKENILSKNDFIKHPRATTIEPILKANILWSSNNHHKLTFPAFQQSLHTFLLCLKANQFKTKLKIPKFVIFEFIKFVDRKSFLFLSSKNKELANSSVNDEPPLKKIKKIK